jgi:hypothetical protein
MLMNKKIITGFLILTLSCLKLISQNDTLPTILSDRPTQTESPFIVPKGYFQMETGLGYIDRGDKEKDLTRYQLASTLLRYGLFSQFELRISSGLEWVNVKVNDSDIDSSYGGLDPVSAGFKVFVVEEKSWRPQMAVVGNITLRHIGNDYLRPTFSYPLGKIICRHNLTQKLSLGYYVGFTWNGEKADGFFIYSSHLGYSIMPRLWAFAEVYGTFDNGDLPNHRGGAGLTYRIRHNLQADISTGLAFSKNVDRFSVTAGLSWRIPG